MYNEDRKMQFINDGYKQPIYGTSVFNRFEQIEIEHGKDLCELDLDVVQEKIDTDFGYKTGAVKNTIQLLEYYNKWCEKNGYPTSGNLLRLNVNVVEKMKKMMVSSPVHLEKILNKVFCPVESETVECVYRCFLWMAFSGIECDDALDVKVNEVNFEWMMIEHNGRSYPLFRESIPAFKMACTAIRFKYLNSNYHEEYNNQYRDRYPGDNLIRGIRSPMIRRDTLNGILFRKFKAADVELSYSKIFLSGVFYKVYEMERSGDDVDFSAYIEDKCAKRGNSTKSAQARLIRSNIKKDYECWKKAFTV